MQSRVRFVPAERKHINRIANLMREIDREECEAMGRTGKQSLRMGMEVSSKAWTAMLGDTPVAMFGVVIDDLLARLATPWFLGTDEVYRCGRELLIWGPPFLACMRTGTGDSSWRLANLVSSRNRQAIRLLERWGCKVADEEVTVRGVAFRRFEKEIG